MSEPVLLVERRGAVACATLNRPARMNALDSGLSRALGAFWRELRDDDSLRAGIVTGAGRAFSAGIDLKEGHDSVPTDVPVLDGTHDRGYPSEVTVGKPLLAAVNGHCIAAGLHLALGCDLRLCSETATFAAPQARLGLATDAHLVLERAGVARAGAMHLILTGETIGADDALRFGIVSRVVPAEALLDEAWRLAGLIAEASPVVVRGILAGAGETAPG